MFKNRWILWIYFLLVPLIASNPRFSTECSVDFLKETKKKPNLSYYTSVQKVGIAPLNRVLVNAKNQKNIYVSSFYTEVETSE